MKAINSDLQRHLNNQAFEVCHCSHILFHHYNDGDNSCYFGPKNQRPSEVQCNCDGYRRDNLRYLEDLDGRV